MSFQDEFSTMLARSGVHLDPAQAPTQENLTEGLRKVSDFFNSLDPLTAAVVDEVTGEFPIKALLADPTVNIAPELASVFHAFDQSNVAFSIISLVAVCAPALNLPPRPPPPGVPNIFSIEPDQASLNDSEGNIVVRWQNPPADKYHFMWTDEVPAPTTLSGWAAVELKAHNTTGFAFQVPNTVVGRTYTFKVQSCKVFDIGADECSAFCPNRSVVMPANTRSLRTFLALSDAHLNPGIRSLGPAAFGAGIRKMMHL